MNKNLIYPLIAFIIVLLGIFYFYFDPLEESFFPKCPFYSITGFYCPGCGSQRALHALIHLDILGVLKNNILFPLGLLIFGYNIVVQFFKYKGRKIKNLLYAKYTPIILLMIFIIFGILRNIDQEPFTYLAPVITN